MLNIFFGSAKSLKSTEIIAVSAQIKHKQAGRCLIYTAKMSIKVQLYSLR